MDNRITYDLSHFSFMAGRIGRLQTLAMVPVVAGDSFTLNMEGVFRLSPLRRNLAVDCMVDLFAFYVPHRHAYGDKWLEFIKQGIDETQTLQGAITGGTRVLNCMGTANRRFTQLPYWIPHAYFSIWDRFFRHPTDTPMSFPLTTVPSMFGDTPEATLNGMQCCWPKTPWNTDVPDFDDSDREVSISSNKLDILDLSRVRARYKSEVNRQWFGQRYNDILGKTWSSSVNIDADERPELIMRKTNWLSGYDVDGTDDAALGSYSGKAAAVIRFGHGRKYFPEHGSYWVMALMRFPMIMQYEINPMCKVIQPNYKDFTADPDLWMNEPPEILDMEKWSGVDTVAVTTKGIIPYGQWYRYHPSLVHHNYSLIDGYPFIDNSPITLASSLDRYYVDSGQYDAVFQTQQLQQWQSQARIGLQAHRYVASPTSSIFAGT